MYLLHGTVCNPGFQSLHIHQTELKVFKKIPINMVGILFVCIDSNYTRMVRAILNKLWRQHPTKQQLYGHLSFTTKIIKVR